MVAVADWDAIKWRPLSPSRDIILPAWPSNRDTSDEEHRAFFQKVQARRRQATIVAGGSHPGQERRPSSSAIDTPTEKRAKTSPAMATPPSALQPDIDLYIDDADDLL
jgi:hypothetical protein